MKLLIRWIVLSLSFAFAGSAATITFTGTVNSTSGFFESLALNGDLVDGTIIIDSVSEDQLPEDPTQGLYFVTSGLFGVLTDFGYGFIDTEVDQAFFWITTSYTEEVQTLSVFADNGYGFLDAYFEGATGAFGKFLQDDSFPQEFNWKAVTSAYGIAGTNPITEVVAVAEVPLAQNDEFVYSIDSVN